MFTQIYVTKCHHEETMSNSWINEQMDEKWAVNIGSDNGFMLWFIMSLAALGHSELMINDVVSVEGFLLLLTLHFNSLRLILTLYDNMWMSLFAGGMRGGRNFVIDLQRNEGRKPCYVMWKHEAVLVAN